jgi:TPR repeat protein
LKYEKGEGIAADPAAAQHWYKMAAAQNYPLAQTRLSQMHGAQVASAGSDGSSCG